MFKSQAQTQTGRVQDVRTLTADELDRVTGGVIGGCIRLPDVGLPKEPTPDWQFKDVFAHYVIGRNLPV